MNKKPKSRQGLFTEYLLKRDGPISEAELIEEFKLTKQQVRGALNGYMNRVLRVDTAVYDLVDRIMQGKGYLYVPNTTEIKDQKLLIINDLVDFVTGCQSERAFDQVNIYLKGSNKSINVNWKPIYQKPYGFRRLSALDVSHLDLKPGEGILLDYVDWSSMEMEYSIANQDTVKEVMASDYTLFLKKQMLRLINHDWRHHVTDVFLYQRYFPLRHDKQSTMLNLYTLASHTPGLITNFDIKVHNYSHTDYFDPRQYLEVFRKKYLYKDKHGVYNPIYIEDIDGYPVAIQANALNYLQWKAGRWVGRGSEVNLYEVVVGNGFFDAE